MASRNYISVILPLKLEWEPCYHTEDNLCVGDRVRVIFAGKEHIGVVSKTGVTPEIAPAKIRGIVAVEKEMGGILEDEIRLWKKVAEYYMCTVGEVYKAAYPQGKITMEQARAEARRRVCKKREKTLNAIVLKCEKLKARLEKKVISAQKAKDGTKAKVSYLADIERIKEEITRAESATHAAELNLDAAKKGLTLNPVIDTDCRIILSAEQDKAYQEILNCFKMGKPVMLHGVTGAGKTEIYIKLAQKAFLENKNVLYLVPEIALSRQLEERLSEHFSDRLITFHSGESTASRRNSAEIIRNSKDNNYIALCTRSGLFLPHHDLGLIIVDEEHDTSYKQDSPAPRYNGRDTALMLSQLQVGCNIILGSATPSLEEIYNTSTGRHAMVHLKERYHGCEDAEIEIIDTKAERKKNGMSGNFSRKLIDRIKSTLLSGEQVLILRSRRAWASALQCCNCGEIQKCTHCNVSMSYHKAENRMTCHYCGCSVIYTGKCSKCGGELNTLGAGTQRIEEEAKKLFPDATVARLDSDTAQNKAQETKIIKGFANGDIDILIGTQIIAKGFDFTNLSLVVIIAADALLGIQDFRADEKALHLMEQFRGRCGRRDKRGRLIIQTSQPEHPIYRQLKQKHDLSDTTLMLERKDFNFPPYSRIIEITIKDLHEDRLDRMSQRLAGRLEEIFGSMTDAPILSSTVTGPYKPMIDRVSDAFIRRIRLCLKKDRMLTSNKSALKKVLADFEKENRYDGHVTVDVDPS